MTNEDKKALHAMSRGVLDEISTSRQRKKANSMVIARINMKYLQQCLKKGFVENDCVPRAMNTIENLRQQAY